MLPSQALGSEVWAGGTSPILDCDGNVSDSTKVALLSLGGALAAELVGNFTADQQQGWSEGAFCPAIRPENKGLVLKHCKQQKQVLMPREFKRRWVELKTVFYKPWCKGYKKVIQIILSPISNPVIK